MVFGSLFYLFSLFLVSQALGRVEMGAKLTHLQWEVFIQVKGALVRGNFHFSRGELKRFVHWLFKYFPNVSWELVLKKIFGTRLGPSWVFYNPEEIFQWGSLILYLQQLLNVLRVLGNVRGMLSPV